MESSQILKCLEINRMQLNRFIEFSKGNLLRVCFNYIEIFKLKKAKQKSLFSGHDFNTAETIIKEQLSNISIDENREKRLVKKYFKYLNQVSQDIANSRSDCKVFYLLLGLIILWVSLLVLVYQLIDQFYNAKKKSKIFLIFGIISHGLSLASTSLIEEEHQTWYFLWMTFCLLMALEFFSMEKLSLFQKLKFSLLWINLCFVHRILRKLNQTGDKWSFLPDIKIFLNSIEGQPWLVISCLSGIQIMFYYKHHAKLFFIYFKILFY